MMYLIDKEQLEYQEMGLGINYDYDFPLLHTHNFWEFVWVIHPIVHVINNKKETIPKNSVLIIKPTDCHAIKAVEGDCNPNKEPTHINMKISEKALLELLETYSPDIILKLKSQTYSALPISEGDTEIFNKLFFNLLNNHNKYYICTMIKACITFIFLKNFCIVFKDENKKVDEIPKTLIELTQKMNNPENFTKNLSTLTDNLFYSKMQLTRLFNKYYGITMIEYFTNAKIAYAKRKLSFSENPIIKIAMELGYTLSHFDHVFKKVVGKSPSKFREENNFKFSQIKEKQKNI